MGGGQSEEALREITGHSANGEYSRRVLSEEWGKKKRRKKKSIKETFSDMSVSLQVTAMIPLGHLGDPEGKHELGEGSEDLKRSLNL